MIAASKKGAIKWSFENSFGFNQKNYINISTTLFGRYGSRGVITTKGYCCEVLRNVSKLPNSVINNTIPKGQSTSARSTQREGNNWWSEMQTSASSARELLFRLNCHKKREKTKDWENDDKDDSEDASFWYASMSFSVNAQNTQKRGVSTASIFRFNSVRATPKIGSLAPGWVQKDEATFCFTVPPGVGEPRCWQPQCRSLRTQKMNATLVEVSKTELNKKWPKVEELSLSLPNGSRRELCFYFSFVYLKSRKKSFESRDTNFGGERKVSLNTHSTNAAAKWRCW